MDSSRTVKRRAGTRPRRWLGMLLSLVLTLGTLGLAAPAAHAAAAYQPTITKDIDNKKDAYDKGDTVTYRLNIQCSSLRVDCKTATVTDVLDSNLTYSSWTASKTNPPVTFTQSGQTLTWTIGDASDPAKYFTAGSTLDIVVNAKVKSVPSNTGRTIDNQASVTSPGADVDKSEKVTIVVNELPTSVYDWGLVKTKASPSSDPAVDGEVTYDVRLTRPRVAATNTVAPGGVDLTSVVLTDTLPAGATFVSATSENPWTTGTFDSSTETITFPAASVAAADGEGVYCWDGDPCKSYFVAHITVKYPSPTFKAEDQPVNKAKATITYADGHTPAGPLTAQATVTLKDVIKTVYTNKYTTDAVNPIPGENVGWVLQAQNTGNVTLEKLVITDAIPDHLTKVQVGASDLYMPMSDGSGSFEYTLDNTTWTSLGTLNQSTSTKLDVPAGAKAVRMTVNNLQVQRYSGFQLFATVADDTPVGYTMDNCMSYDGSPGPHLKSNCASYTVKEKPQANVYTGKRHLTSAGVGAHVNPGDELSWLLEWRTMGNTLPTKTTVTDLLPSQFELVTEEPPCLEYGSPWGDPPADCAADATHPAYTTAAVAGGTMITFTDLTLPTLPDQYNYAYRIRLHVRAKDGTAAGNYTNSMSVLLPSNYEATCNWGGDCTSTDTVAVDTAAAAGLKKWDKGTEPNVAQDTGKASASCPDWNGFTRYPCVAQTLPGGDLTYRVRWSNQGNVPLTNAIVYDILPFVGDTGVSQVLSGAERGTVWSPVLTGPIVLDGSLSTATDSGYVVEYNTTTDPCRPELKSGDADGTWQSSCDNTWVTSVSDWSTVKSFRIKAYQASGATWTPGQEMVFTVPMKAPADAPASTISPLDLSIAWNSAAQRVFQVQGSGPVHLQANEPPMVGVIIPAPYVSIGDYVWYDTNYNGKQDTGELPAKGVKVTLKDKDGNVVGTTATDDDGYYWFQNLTEKAQYTLEFIKPDGYTWTIRNSGSDDAIDSDIDPATSKISFTAPTWVQGTSKNLGGHNVADDPTLDAGLVVPIPQVSVGDYVWKDLDKDGIQDSGEPGIQGVVLTIKDETGQPVKDVAGNTVGPVTTDANGYYLFPALPIDHTYTVTIDQAASATALTGLAPTLANQGGDTAKDSSTGSATSVPMTIDGQQDLTLDFGFIDAPVSIGDYLWWDANRDGLQDSNELPVKGVVVVLKDASGVIKGTMTTGDDGFYWFTDLVGGQNYTLYFTPPTGSTWTLQNASNDSTNNPATDKTDSDVNPADGTIAFTAPTTGSNGSGAPDKTDNPTLDGGLVKYNLTLAKSLVTTGPFVPGQDVTYKLVPHNDGPVAALAGWSVTDILPTGLTFKSIAGTDYDCVDATVTCTAKSALAAGADGNEITVIATINDGFNGTAHNVAYVAPFKDDVAETNPLVKPDGTTDTSKTETDNDAQADLKVDVVSIGDYVWWDVNRNGQQDAGEPVVSGVVVNLLDPVTLLPVKTTTTDANGYYYFNNLQPNAQYIVEFVKPTGTSLTTQTAANVPTSADSNPDTATGRTAVITTPTSGSNKITAGDTDDPTIDAGLVKYNLTLSKSLDTAGPFYVGKDVTYTLIPHNDGPVAALAGWSVTDILPTGLTFKSMSSTDTSYTCSAAKCTNNAPLAANSNGPAITVVATVNADFTGVAHNVAYVSPAESDVPETNPLAVPDTNTDTSKTTTDNDAQADLEVKKVSIGDYVWWDADRDGQQTAGEPFIDGVTVNLIKDGTVVATTTTKDGGYYAFGDLVPHTAYTVEFVKPDGSTFTTQTKGATASDSNPDVTTGKADVLTPDTGSNSLLPNTADDPTIDAGLVKYNLTLAKSLDTAGPFIPGQTVTYTLTPHNDGPVAALAGWSVTEVVPAQFESMTMSGDGYTCAGVTCTASAPLAAGADGGKITVTAVLKKDILGKIHNVAYVAPVEGDIVETNVLVIPDTTTDTSTTGTDNDAQADLEIVPVSIGDYVWMDDNRNGQQDIGESPVAHMVVKLMKDGSEVGSTETDDNGYYAFKDLYPGTDYTVVFVKPADTSFTYRYTGAAASDSNADNATGEAAVTTPRTGSNLTDPTKADDPTIDAGLVKFNLTLAKTLDTAKPYVPNQTVVFTLVPHNDGPSTALKGWTVTEIVPSQLTLVSMVGAGYTCSGTVCTADAELAGGADGGPITVTATINADALGDIHNVAYVTPFKDDVPETNPLVVPDTNTDTSTSPTDNDAQASLRVQPVSVGDYVWWDVNRDGQQQANEPAVPGVTVILHNADGSVKATTVTGDDGYYAFTSLQPHTDYWVEFVKPDGTTYTYQLTGATASDSNADVTTGYTPQFTTPSEGNNSALPNQADDPTIDAGLWSRINLVLDKHLATNGPFVQGDKVTFWLSPSNEGPMDALAGWSVTEVLPEGLTLVSMTGDNYTCVDVTCTSTVQLAAGATGEPIRVVATINDKAYGKVHNVAYVAPAPGEIPETNPLDVPDTNTNTSKTSTDNDAQAELCLEPPAISLDKIAHLDDFNGNGYADAGETIHYIFKVTNIGGVRLAPVTISDEMLGLDDADCVDSLGVGETATCSTKGSYTVTSDDVESRRSIHNTATTTGRVPGTHDKVYSTDDETVPVGHKVLPQTGGDIPLWAGIGAPLLLIAGAGLLFVGRRGRKTADTTK